MNPARHLIAILLGGGLVTATTQAQQAIPALAPVAMVDPASETAALQRLSEHLQARHSELEMQRQALREERDRLSAVDQPASAEQMAQWRDRADAGTHIRQRVEVLQGLLAALTPQALQAIPPPKEMEYEFLTSDAGLKSTSLEVALRDAPEGTTTALLPEGTLVVQLAADAGGRWSVVVTANGSGFVLTSMLKGAD